MPINRLHYEVSSGCMRLEKCHESEREGSVAIRIALFGFLRQVGECEWTKLMHVV